MVVAKQGTTVLASVGGAVVGALGTKYLSNHEKEENEFDTSVDIRQEIKHKETIQQSFEDWMSKNNCKITFVDSKDNPLEKVDDDILKTIMTVLKAQGKDSVAGCKDGKDSSQWKIENMPRQ